MPIRLRMGDDRWVNFGMVALAYLTNHTALAAYCQKLDESASPR